MTRVTRLNLADFIHSAADYVSDREVAYIPVSALDVYLTPVHLLRRLPKQELLWKALSIVAELLDVEKLPACRRLLIEKQVAFRVEWMRIDSSRSF